MSSEAPTTVQMIAPRSMKFAAWASTAAAVLALFTARSVYQGEQERAMYEKMRYTHATYSSYIDFRRSRGRTLKCTAALLDSNKVSDDDLKAILLHERGVEFKYDKVRHADLAECVDGDDVRALFEEERWDKSQKRKALDAMDDKLAWSVTVLDAALVGYFRDIGDKIILCENFAGFLQTGQAQAGFGIPGRYLQRLMSPGLKLLRADNYPNLHRFTSDVAKLTEDYTKPLSCDRLVELYPPKPRLVELWIWSKDQFHHWIW